MPIKADINLNSDSQISRNSSILNINNNNNNSTSNNANHSAATNSSSKKTSIKSESGVNEKFSRIEGGEQQIVVSFLLFLLAHMPF